MTQFISVKQWQQIFHVRVPQTVLAIDDTLRQDQWSATISQNQVDPQGGYYCQIKNNTEAELTAMPLLPSLAPGKSDPYGMTSTLKKNTAIQLLQTHQGAIILGAYKAFTENLFELNLHPNQNCVLTDTHWLIANQHNQQTCSLEFKNKFSSFLWQSTNDKHWFLSKKSYVELAESIEQTSKKITHHIYGKQSLDVKHELHFKIKNTIQIQSINDATLIASQALSVNSAVLAFSSYGFQGLIEGSWIVKSCGCIDWQSGRFVCETKSLNITVGHNHIDCKNGVLTMTGAKVNFTAPIISLKAQSINPELVALMMSV